MPISKAHENLIKWVVRNDGYLHPDVELAHTSEKGSHVVVCQGKTIAAMTRIASCPMAATLSILNAMAVPPFRCQGTMFPPSFVRNHSPKVISNFFLVEQYVLGPKSWWAAYVATLPQPSDDSCFTAEDLLWIKGTNLENAYATQIEKWQEEYAAGLDELRKRGWQGAVKGLYTWKLYHWAATMFGSRSFTSQVLADTLPADRARPIGRHDGHGQHDDLTALFSDGFPVLLPLLDLLNYKPRARVEWQARYSFVGLQVLDEFDSGEELCNNYGPRDNETLLLGYGFALEHNPYDHFSVALKVPPGSPLEDARTWPQDLKSDPGRRCYVFNVQHPRAQAGSCLEFALFSYDLLDSISILSGNDRELQTMYLARKTLLSAGLKAGFPDYRNVLSTTSQLLQECRVRLKALETGEPTSQDLSRSLTSSAISSQARQIIGAAEFYATTSPSVHQPRVQSYAQTYRRSQLEILKTAVQVCIFVLARARLSWTDDALINIVGTVEGTEPAALRSLVERHKCITRSNELFSVEDFLNLLQKPPAATLRACISSLGGYHESTPPKDVVNAKTQFAIILSALQIEHSRGQILPQRLRAWIDQLTQWYPPSDPNWSYVPPDKVTTPPEEAPPPMLMVLLKQAREVVDGDADSRRWLKPETLCWGWNVMEEEGVRVPKEIAELKTAEADAGGSFLIYCPQL